MVFNSVLSCITKDYKLNGQSILPMIRKPSLVYLNVSFQISYTHFLVISQVLFSQDPPPPLRPSLTLLIIITELRLQFSWWKSTKDHLQYREISFRSLTCASLSVDSLPHGYLLLQVCMEATLCLQISPIRGGVNALLNISSDQIRPTRENRPFYRGTCLGILVSIFAKISSHVIQCKQIIGIKPHNSS